MYQHLSSSEITLFILDKGIAAKIVKKGLRDSFGDLINNLNSNQKRGFSLDLIHGSDEGEGLKELGIISGSEVGILSVDYLLKVRGLKM